VGVFEAYRLGPRQPPGGLARGWQPRLLLQGPGGGRDGGVGPGARNLGRDGPRRREVQRTGGSFKEPSVSKWENTHHGGSADTLHVPLRVASAGVPPRQGGRGHYRVHARVRFCSPRAVALAPAMCIYHQVPAWCPEHEVAARLQISSPKPGRRARGEGTNKVSVRQGGGMPAHFQPLCAPTAFNPRCGTSCGLSKEARITGQGGVPPTPCCRRGRPGGWSEAPYVLRGARSSQHRG